MTVRSAITFFLILHAAVGIEPLLLLDVVAREDDHIPAAHIAYTACLESETVHAEGYLLGREGALHRAADELDDARGGEELAHLVAIGHAQVGGDELLLHAGLLELAVVALELGIVVGIEPVAEARAVERVGLTVHPVVGHGVCPWGVDVAHEEGEPAAVVGEVGEEARVVARAAEGGDVGAALLVAGEGGTLVHRGVGGDGLELVELRGLQAVELLERDEGHLGELQAVVLAHASGKVLGGEVAAELGGQEVAHEGALVDALRADVGEYLVVGLVGFEPRGHHGHEPLLEEAVVHLLRAARDVHHGCHLVDVVDAVPRGQALQILP